MPEPWRGKSVWKVSFGSTDYARVKKAHPAIWSQCSADFEAAERARRGERPASSSVVRRAVMPAVEEIEADELSRLLVEDEAERSDGDARRQLQTAEERSKWPDLTPIDPNGRWMEDDHHHAYGLEIEEEHAGYAKALSKADFRPVRVELGDYLKRKNISIDPASEGYREAGLAVLRAHVRAAELKLSRQHGKIVTTPAPSAGRGPTLSEAYEAWKTGSGARGSRKPSERTLLEAAYAVRRLTEWHGNIRLADLTRQKAVEFRAALVQVPTRLPAPLSRLPLRDLLKRTDLAAYPAVHAATINKSLTILAAIVSHAEAAGQLDSVPGFRNPFGKGIKLVVNAAAEEGRQPFSEADLSAIFSTGVFRGAERPTGGGGEAAFWLPVLALLTGARQGELAQLRIMDLAQDRETGIWHLDIGTGGGRTIKTASSRRKVPLHPALEGIGLLRYRQWLLAEGAGLESPLWPQVEADGEGRRNGPWSKWFTRFLRGKAGITDPGKVFHSFRHTWKDLARNAKLPLDVHDAITGHVGGGVGRTYGAGFGLKVLAEEVARIEAPGAVRGLRWRP